MCHLPSPTHSYGFVCLSSWALSDINNLNNEICLNTVWFVAHHQSAEVVPKDTLQTVQLSASTENIKPSHFPHYKIQYKISQYCVNIKFSFCTK
jgi:hypothetical protein